MTIKRTESTTLVLLLGKTG